MDSPKIQTDPRSLTQLSLTAMQKAMQDIHAHGIRDPWKVLREAIDLSNTFIELLDRNPDSATVQEYAASIGALMLQISLAAPVVFTSQPSIFSEPDRQITLDLHEAA